MLLPPAVDTDASGFNYDRNGDDWEGLCQTGEEQSPINIDTSEEVELDEPELKVSVEDVGEVEGLSIFSTGAALEVIWTDFARMPNITVAAQDGDIYTIFSKNGTKALEAGDVERLTAEPIQFHFHSPSENAFNGRLAPLCVHIVCKISEGQSDICDEETCLVVLGVHYEYDDPEEDNEVLAPLWEELPTEVGKEVQLMVFRPFLDSTSGPHCFLERSHPELVAQQDGDEFQDVTIHGNIESVCKAHEMNGVMINGTFDLNDLLPKNREHFTWKGSLTTPPCTEGVLWVMYSDPVLVSTAQVNAHQQTAAFAVGPDCANVTKAGECDPPRQSGNHRPIQPHNGRVIRMSET
ncbi:hypothetical protein BSKO_12680 [Bryopsis sp. KO-2023]|nr:hypothetical protein BSKO_12680 [Bryopsis sp. KO-2023]